MLEVVKTPFSCNNRAAYCWSGWLLNTDFIFASFIENYCPEIFKSHRSRPIGRKQRKNVLETRKQPSTYEAREHLLYNLNAFRVESAMKNYHGVINLL